MPHAHWSLYLLARRSLILMINMIHHNIQSCCQCCSDINVVSLGYGSQDAAIKLVWRFILLLLGLKIVYQQERLRDQSVPDWKGDLRGTRSRVERHTISTF